MDKSTRLLAVGGTFALVAVLLVVMGTVYVGRSETQPIKQPFALVDMHGEPVDEGVFEGRPSLVYFGYTSCPEVCPTTLIEMSDWLEALGQDGRDVQALFFTVDPERDTPDVLAPYVASISDRIRAVTGEPEEMRKALRYWLAQAERRGEGERYSMSHSTALLLIGADGRMRGFIPYGTGRDEAIDQIRRTLLRGATA